MEPPVPDPGEAAVIELPAGAADAALASPAMLRTGDMHCGLFTARIVQSTSLFGQQICRKQVCFGAAFPSAALANLAMLLSAAACSR